MPVTRRWFPALNPIVDSASAQQVFGFVQKLCALCRIRPTRELQLWISLKETPRMRSPQTSISEELAVASWITASPEYLEA